ncbi:MAG: 4Fe-4S dicluster domain-containing protein [Oxalobacter sp.]|nr:MAG: 4Fe-4S dicluster domain-containing protein [Oxalobacter sp.]
MNSFVIAEPDKCIGCGSCEIACVLAHPIDTSGMDVPASVNFKPRLKVIKGAHAVAPVQCRQCENAPCVNVCPTNALVYDKNSVQLLADRCIGCKTCVLACPFGAMEMTLVPQKRAGATTSSGVTFVSVAHKCDLCVNLATGPACIQACPSQALRLVDPQSIRDKVNCKREKSLLSLHKLNLG